MELDPAILHILVRRRRLLSRKIVELNAILEVTPLLLDEDDNSDNNEPVHGGFNELLSRWLPIAPQAVPPVEMLLCNCLQDFDPADLAREASSSPTNARGANRQVQTPAFHDHSDRVHHCDPADALSSYIIRHFLSGLHFDITKVSSRDPLADNQLETEVATGANIDTVALRLCLLMISDVEACRDVRTGNETAWV
ncbi:hypothetical protein PGT21_004166 [Puccinia graminis f. sp. tritici]|uniref:Uncharacterized protein n=1 Tax=Puccinia graminis f. sp. tritici TaxID=56615 RepID=A0A5B0M2C5_PUCGR|nr:hypothetical protein PGTUg99_007954 [Puccinia graminis f. sp. tritici]KAA1099345.1 hypothetical protein PGT21_004166 [Puccinia graminis f. sp. tritici]